MFGIDKLPAEAQQLINGAIDKLSGAEQDTVKAVLIGLDQLLKSNEERIDSILINTLAQVHSIIHDELSRLLGTTIELRFIEPQGPKK